MATESKVVKIESSRFPKVFPTLTFKDKVQFPDGQRVIKTGVEEAVLIETEKKYETKSDAFLRERPVQAVIYNKYKLEIRGYENSRYETLKYRDLIYITLDNDEVHQAKVIEDTLENPADTTLSVFTIEYYDINKDNYPINEQPILNYADSDFLFENVPDKQKYTLKLRSTRSIDEEWEQNTDTVAPGAPDDRQKLFYTEFKPESPVSDHEQSIEKVDSENLLVSDIVKNLKVVTIHTNEFNAFFIKKYAPLCDIVEIEGSQNKEFSATDIAVSQEGADLYRVEITIATQILTFDNLEE